MNTALEKLRLLRMEGFMPKRVNLLIGEECHQTKWWEDFVLPAKIISTGKRVVYRLPATIEDLRYIDIVLNDDSAMRRADLRPMLDCNVSILCSTLSDNIRYIAKKLVSIVGKLDVWSEDRKCLDMFDRETGWEKINLTGDCNG
jgi:hypothetical protein